jgi:hypothetical protein
VILLTEDEKKIIGETTFQVFNKERGSTYIRFNPEDSEKLRPYLEGKRMIFRFDIEKVELCLTVKKLQYPYD